MKYLLLALLLVPSISWAQALPAAKFDQNGQKLQPPKRGEVVKDEGYKTIAQWLEMATTARSAKFREAGSESLRCITEYPATLSSADKDALAPAAVKLLAGREPAVKTNGLKILELHGGSIHTAAVLKLTKDTDHEVRLAAVSTLANIGDASCAAALGSLALARQDDQAAIEVARAAIDALGKIGGPACKKVLEDLEAKAMSEDAKVLIQEALDELDSKAKP